MGRFDGVLICSDIDGTLTRKANEVVPADRAAIDAFRREGGRFVLTTGRPPSFLETFPLKSDVPLICLNGSLVWDPEQKQALHRWPLVLKEEICSYFSANADAWYQLHWEDFSESYPADELARRVAERAMPLMKIVVVFKDPERALSFRLETERLFGADYSVNRTWDVGVEILAKEAGKGECLPILRRHLPQVHTVVGVGDFENDVSLLRAADRSFAPANADETTKNAAQTVLSVPAGGAIAELISVLRSEAER